MNSIIIKDHSKIACYLKNVILPEYLKAQRHDYRQILENQTKLKAIEQRVFDYNQFISLVKCCELKALSMDELKQEANKNRQEHSPIFDRDLENLEKALGLLELHRYPQLIEPKTAAASESVSRSDSEFFKIYTYKEFDQAYRSKDSVEIGIQIFNECSDEVLKHFSYVIPDKLLDDLPVLLKNQLIAPKLCEALKRNPQLLLLFDMQSDNWKTEMRSLLNIKSIQKGVKQLIEINVS
ncbi:hypothetical protein GJ496_011793 [Pomphorhynchus laevis]|nr:hypothetical protein GJ496_011793 [Pomphorhynchus laevis]